MQALSKGSKKEKKDKGGPKKVGDIFFLGPLRTPLSCVCEPRQKGKEGEKFLFWQANVSHNSDMMEQNCEIKKCRHENLSLGKK